MAEWEGIDSEAPGGNRAVRRLYAQYEVVKILAESDDFATAGPRVLEAISESLGWQSGSVWLRADATERLRCEAAWQVPALAGQPFAIASDELTFDVGVGLPGRVMARAEPLWVEDVTADPGFLRADAARAAGLHAALAFPICWGQEVLGVMEFFACEVRRPDHELLEAVESVGTQLGQFITRKRAEQRLRESEALNRAVVEAALDCVITMNSEGRIVDFNRAAEAAFGYRRDEVVGREMAELIIPPSLRSAHREALKRRQGGGPPRILDQRLELSGMRAGGEEFPVELTVTQLADTVPPIYAGFIRDITARVDAERQRERALQAEREARARTEELVAEALEAEQREHERISQRLHDDVLQNLAVAKLYLGATDGEGPRTARARAALQQSLQSVRDTISELHPVILRQGGLTSALAGILRSAERRGEFACTLELDPRATGLHDELILAAVRELLSNVAKHADASQAEVALIRREDGIELRVSDDGSGLGEGRPAEALGEGHVGLASLKSRAEGLGGRLRTERSPQHQTVVILTLPAASAAQDLANPLSGA